MSGDEEQVALVWRRGDVILDLYEVRDVVHSGGMGLVYRVLHRGWNVELAVKAPRAAIVDTPAGVRRFEAEAETWVGLGLHPHTVSCVYVRRLGGLPRVFAEWVNGGSLHEAVGDGRLYEDGRRVALRRILDVAIQMAWGLQHAHEHRLIHRDVKPANVLLSPDGTAKVTDFGLATARAAAQERTDDAPTASAGWMTRAYCSPEQARAAAGGHELLTPATDTWSWALSVWEMFEGQPPTRYGQGAAQTFAARTEAPPPDPRIPPLPGPIAELLGRCFAENPSARPPRMGQIADALIEIYAYVVGEPYPRMLPAAAKLLADGLSNHALSMIDLGQTQQAEELWERALQADPRHPHAVYNRGLHRWRGGRVTDQQLVAELESVRVSHVDDWIDEYLLGLVQLERGDVPAAEELLRDAAHNAPGNSDVLAALALACRAPAARRPTALDGHAERVTSVALSEPGHLALTTSWDETIRVSDPRTGRLLRTLSHRSGCASVAMSADGRVAVSGGDETAQVWETATGRCVRTLPGHSSMVRSVAVSADGRVALTCSDDGAVHAWELDTGRCLRTQEAPRLPGLSAIFAGEVAVDSTGRLALGWYESSGAIEVWNVATGATLYGVECHAPQFALSGDGRIAVAIAAGPTMRVWELESGRMLHTGAGHGELHGAVAVSNDGRLVLSAGEDGSVRVWEAGSGRCLRTHPCHMSRVESIALSGDGRVALVGGFDGGVSVLELAAAGARAPWSYPRPPTIDELGERASLVDAALGQADRLIEQRRTAAAADVLRAARELPGHRRNPDLLERWWRVGLGGRRTGVSAAWLRHDLPSRPEREGWIAKGSSVALSPDGRLAITSDEGGSVRVWDVATGSCVHELRGHRGPVTAVALSTDGRLLLSAGADGVLRVWALETGACLHVLQSGHADTTMRVIQGSQPVPELQIGGDRIAVVAVSADGRRALSGGRDGKVQVWDLSRGRCLRTLPGANGFVNALAISADGRLAVSNGYDAPTRVWDLDTGRCVHELRGHTRFVRVVAMSMDGQTVVSGGDDRTLRVWDLTRGQCVQTLQGHTAEVMALAVSSDGHLALSSGPDTTVRVWELASGRCLHTLEGHNDWVGSLVVGHDARFALSGSDDRTVRVWDLATGRCLHVLEQHPAGVESVSLSAEARLVLCGCEDGIARVWELDWDFHFDAPGP